ncbi:MAG TPA: alpha/beta fold hydrolase [Mycobacteriales bacterium]|nr:alpha/beta fold hydrolase [Mycobacteriales bacterium]
MRRETASLHGHEISYITAGETGPVVVLLHGIAGCADTWSDVIDRLSDSVRIVAPDLLGHGQSAKPRGDYSLGAYASGVRDLTDLLGHERVTVVGHSLGGGVAMQFAYQFPEHTERLVLVSSGGLGRQVTPLLRAATLPFAEYVMPIGVNPRLRNAAQAVGRALPWLSDLMAPAAKEIARGYGSLADTEALRAFVHTCRAVMDLGGQRIDASDRLYLAAGLPTLIVWGARDRFIPVAHAHAAAALLPAARVEIFERAGHFPHRDEPARFAATLLDFFNDEHPATLSADMFRERLRLRG